jgi:uncharacterized protein YjiS (DUF1127 family)
MRLAAIHTLTATSSAVTVTESGSSSTRSSLLGSLFTAIRSWLARRAVLAELRELDDRTLADLSIYPGDFPAIADGTYVREGGALDRQANR